MATIGGFMSRSSEDVSPYWSGGALVMGLYDEYRDNFGDYELTTIWSDGELRGRARSGVEHIVETLHRVAHSLADDQTRGQSLEEAERRYEAAHQAVSADPDSDEEEAVTDLRVAEQELKEATRRENIAFELAYLREVLGELNYLHQLIVSNDD